MGKQIKDLTVKIRNWIRVLPLKIYVDYEGCDGKIKVGQLLERDKKDQNMKYKLRDHNDKDSGWGYTWVSDKEIVGIHRFPRKQNLGNGKERDSRYYS